MATTRPPTSDNGGDERFVDIRIDTPGREGLTLPLVRFRPLSPLCHSNRKEGEQGNKMSPQLLQVNYKFNGSRADFEREFGTVAVEIAKVPGLRWKMWLVNEAESSGGGCYLFDDEASLLAYLAGPVITALKSHPAFSQLSVQTFAVLERPTAVTRGPLDVGSGMTRNPEEVTQ